MGNESKSRPKKMRWHTARRHRNVQLALNCREELAVIADYRRSAETELLLGPDCSY